VTIQTPTALSSTHLPKWTRKKYFGYSQCRTVNGIVFVTRTRILKIKPNPSPLSAASLYLTGLLIMVVFFSRPHFRHDCFRRLSGTCSLPSFYLSKCKMCFVNSYVDTTWVSSEKQLRVSGDWSYDPGGMGFIFEDSIPRSH
jgi:hypothetical protein